MDPRIASIEKEFVRSDLPAFSPGDTVRVRVRVREGGKERIQPFEGICIGRRGAGVNATFTLRRISGGVGVERIFPAHSPWIAGIEIVRRGDVRRAKLYYLRSREGKRARVRERKWWLDKPGDTAAPVAATPDPVDEAAEMAAETDEDEGGIAAAVAGAVESVKDVVDDVVEKVSDVAEDIGDRVEDAVEAVMGDDDDEAEDAAEAADESDAHKKGSDEE